MLSPGISGYRRYELALLPVIRPWRTLTKARIFEWVVSDNARARREDQALMGSACKGFERYGVPLWSKISGMCRIAQTITGGIVVM